MGVALLRMENAAASQLVFEGYDDNEASTSHALSPHTLIPLRPLASTSHARAEADGPTSYDGPGWREMVKMVRQCCEFEIEARPSAASLETCLKASVGEIVAV